MRLASVCLAQLDSPFRAVNDPTVQRTASLNLSASDSKPVSEQMFHLLEHLDTALLVTDAQGLITWVNKGFTRLTEYTLDDLKGKSPGAVLQGPDTDPSAVNFMRQRLRARQGFRAVVLNYTKSEQPYWISLDVQPIYDDHGQLLNFFALAADVTENSESMRMALSSARQGIWQWDLVAQRFSLTAEFLKLFGYTRERAGSIDGSLRDLVHVQDIARVDKFYAAMAAGQMQDKEVEYRMRASDGRWHWIRTRGRAVRRGRDGGFTQVCGIHSDITRERAAASEAQKQSQSDAITTLPNRAALKDHLGHVLSMAARHHKRAAVLHVNLDNFKSVNEAYGQSGGDALLTEVGSRIRQDTRTEDYVARLGADEFVVVLPELMRDEDPAQASRRVAEALRLPIDVDGSEVFINASIGIAVFPQDSTDVNGLLRNADAAMHHVKQNGKNGYRFFTADMHDQVMTALKIETRLRAALMNDALELHYQPIVDAQQHTVIGAEALLRWNDEVLGNVPAQRFIAVAERCGLMVPIGTWALRAACRQSVRFARVFGVNVLTSVNLSAAQFADNELLMRVRAVLQDTGADPQYILLELTEAALMEAGEGGIAKLHALKALGVKLAIDDFGTGFVSLANLSKLPIDKLKIDRSFVQELPSSQQAGYVANAIIDLAKRLKLKVNAEGVETLEQAKFLTDSKCHELQGYLFAKPLRIAELEMLLRRQRD